MATVIEISDWMYKNITDYRDDNGRIDVDDLAVSATRVFEDGSDEFADLCYECACYVQGYYNNISGRVVFPRGQQ